MSDDEDERYQVRDPREGRAGKALIINVLNKYTKKYREGSKRDVKKMKEVLSI